MNKKKYSKRGTVVICIFAMIFVLFGVNLFRMQILDTTQESQTSVSSYDVTVEAVRGEILDRNGYPLVTNKQENKIIFTYSSFPTDYAERNKIILELIKMFKQR